MPSRAMRLPPRVKAPAEELKTSPSNCVSGAKSLLGFGRVLPSNVKIVPADGASSASQFAAVVQLSSLPPPSQMNFGVVTVNEMLLLANSGVGDVLSIAVTGRE